MFAQARRIVQFPSFYSNTLFYRKDLWKVNLSNVDVIAVYGLHPIMDRLGENKNYFNKYLLHLVHLPYSSVLRILFKCPFPLTFAFIPLNLFEIGKKMQAEASPGTIIVSNVFSIPGENNRNLVFRFMEKNYMYNIFLTDRLSLHVNVLNDNIKKGGNQFV